MEITCSLCRRKYETDPALTAGRNAARCLCGERITLASGNLDASLPRQLGQYILVKRIAAGGMGEVYYGKVSGVEGFEREVAIKKILPHLSEERAFVEMMINEAKLTVLLRHPNVVQIFDLAKHGKDYFIAMEFVPGITVGYLLQHLYRNRAFLPHEVAIYIVMEVLRGLAYAHNMRGHDGTPMPILHRDITPQNILVTKDAWVKITDFGIAKARNEISTTSPDVLKGKVGYIAPEQLEGIIPDQRLDIFCAGILMWEALTSRRLFKGKDEIHTLHLIAKAVVPPLEKFRDDIPREYELTLRKALARNPAQRYFTAAEFLDALNQAIFPHTADDFANISKSYFDSHPELFVEIEKIIATEEHLSGVAGGEVPPTPDYMLPEISELTLKSVRPAPPVPSSVPSAKRRGNGVLVVVLLTLVALVAVVGVLFKDTIKNVLEGSFRPSISIAQEVQSTVDGETRRLIGCYTDGPESLRSIENLVAKLAIPPAGGVSSVTLSQDDGALGNAAMCLRDVLRSLPVRAHDDQIHETYAELPSPARHTAPLPEKVIETIKPRNKKKGKGQTKASVKVPPSAVSDPEPEPDQVPAPTVENAVEPVVEDAPALKPLTGNEVQAAVKMQLAAVQKCMGALAGKEGIPSSISVQIRIATSGQVSGVDLKPNTGLTTVDECLRRTFMKVRTRPQPTVDFPVSFPLTLNIKN